MAGWPLVSLKPALKPGKVCVCVCVVCLASDDDAHVPLALRDPVLIKFVFQAKREAAIMHSARVLKQVTGE